MGVADEELVLLAVELFVNVLLVPLREPVGEASPNVPCKMLTLVEEVVLVLVEAEEGRVPLASAKVVAILATELLTILVAVYER